MATELSSRRPLIIKVVILIVLIIMFIIGVWCMCNGKQIISQSYVKRYDDVCKDEDNDRNCSTFIPTVGDESCNCNVEFELDKDLKGEVTLYYELPTFDQSNKTYAMSRDDSQLTSGNPCEHPAPSCGNFSYYNNTPIFPCGEVADSMFTDQFVHLSRVEGDSSKQLSVSYTNLLTPDTPQFKNPPPEVLKNFTMPKGWPRDINGKVINHWEQSDLKGIESPAFRAWMDTKLTRKPVFRIKPSNSPRDRRGLQAGTYRMKIFVFYGADRYNGVRNFILEGKYIVFGPRNLVAGIILVILSLSTMLAGGGYEYYKFLKNNTPKKTGSQQLASNDNREEPLLNRIRNRFSEWRAS